MHDQSQFYSALATLLVLGLVVRRALRTQTVRVWSLLAVPALVVALACIVVAATPPRSALGFALIGAGAVAGAGIGYARGRHSKVTPGPRPGTLVVQGNLALAAILVGAFAVRFAVRASAGAHGPLTLALSDAFIVFAAASVVVARGMLFFAWRRLPSGSRGPAGAA